MYGNSSVPTSESLKNLCEMFPAVDPETIRLMLAECGSFERTMDRLLQGDRSVTWKSNKSRSQGPEIQSPQQQSQYYAQNYSQQNQVPHMMHNTKYSNESYHSNSNHPMHSPVKRPTSNPPPSTDIRLFLPPELRSEMNTSIFGYLDSDPVKGGKLIRTKTKDMSFQSNSPFSAMPMEINPKKSDIDSKKYPNWNFNDDMIAYKHCMTPSKSFDSLKHKKP